MDIGFAQAGFDIAFANDIDPFAIATHKKTHLSKDPKWAEAAKNLANCESVVGDVRDFNHLFYEGMSDLVIGGPPCQGFSVAGRMDPEDPRSKHVFDYLAIVGKIRPKAFVMENVAALAQNKRWADVIENLQEHASTDYKTQLVVLNASHWGVPQKRERMFLIGLTQDAPDVDFSAKPTESSLPTVRDTFSTLPAWGEEGNDSLCTAKITPAKNPILRKSAYAGMLFNGQGRPMNLDMPAPTLPASMGGNRTPIVDQANLENPSVSPWIEGYHHQLFVENQAPITAVPDEARLRRITVQEAAALQTFPRDMQWSGTQSVQFRQIGNAVPPRLALAVAEAVKKSVFSS
jgi:DNA (cytosine-5-)-methyltransferase